jgi:hypothetical protein
VIQKIKNSLKKRKVKVFLACLIFSTFAWVISNLSESYVSNTTFDLEFSNISDDLLLVDSSQDQINAKLQAVGFQFLGFNFKNKAITIDLSEVVKKGTEYNIPYKKFKVQIEKQLPNSMRIIDLEKDTLFFNLQEVITKEVSINPRVQLSLSQNFLLEDKLIVSPSTVILKGPRNEIDTVNSITSEQIEIKDISADFSRNVNLIIPVEFQQTSISTKAVTISGKVSRFSEKIIDVRINATNLPTGTTIKMFPDKVQILCKGTINALKNIDASAFNVVADFNTIGYKESKTIQLSLDSKPDVLSNVILQETEVEYILKREQ